MASPISNSDAAISIANSALRAQQARMRIIAENIANSDSIATTPGGTPYQRQVPVFQPATTDDGGKGVRMVGVRPDGTPFHREYNPSAPGADAQGYLMTPNVDPLTEGMDLKEAQRAYEANLNVIQAMNSMESRTLDLIKK
ncbi:MAG: flagellar basal body rod protein FlgC [Caulobacteraceae bacterium]